MLSKEEKREILQDAKSKRQRENFRAAKGKNFATALFDAYLSFLDGIQKIFSPFRITSRHTITKFNKL